MLTKVLNLAVRASLAVALIFIVASHTPQITYATLRNSVGPKVVLLRASEGSRGAGTGVHIQAPNGTTYLLTNSHICEMSTDGTMAALGQDGKTWVVKILLDSVFSDLCLLEPVPGVRGIPLASYTPIGVVVTVLGHPKALPLTVTMGELVGLEEVSIMTHVVDPSNPKDCTDPKEKQEPSSNPWSPEEVACMLSIMAYWSNIPVLPGSSGSPVVNEYGELVGLVFALNDGGWAAVVPLGDVMDLLAQVSQGE